MATPAVPRGATVTVPGDPAARIVTGRRAPEPSWSRTVGWPLSVQESSPWFVKMMRPVTAPSESRTDDPTVKESGSQESADTIGAAARETDDAAAARLAADMRDAACDSADARDDDDSDMRAGAENTRELATESMAEECAAEAIDARLALEKSVGDSHGAIAPDDRDDASSEENGVIDDDASAPTEPESPMRGAASATVARTANAKTPERTTTVRAGSERIGIKGKDYRRAVSRA